MKKEFFINEPIIEAKDFIKKEMLVKEEIKHPHEIPLYLGAEFEYIITTSYSFVIRTIKNQNHKLEKMLEGGIEDVTFIRVEKSKDVKWYFEDHKTPRLADRLTNELEEKTSVYRRPKLIQTVGRGNRPSELSKLYFHITDTPLDFLKHELGRPWQEPKERKESQQPKRPEFPEWKTEKPNFVKKITNLFARNKK